MNLSKFWMSRRTVLAGGTAALLSLAGRLWLRSARAQQTASGITAAAVSRAPLAPEDALWGRAKPTPVVMLPQNLVLPRLVKSNLQALNVQALYDAARLAVRLEWPDAHKDDELGTVQQYRDGVAIQFPVNPAGPAPSFMMGQPGSGVVIYHWKSDWQFSLTYDVDEAYPNMYGDYYPFSGVEAGEMPEATDYLTKGRREYLTAAAVGNSLADPFVQKRIGPIQKMRAEGYGTLEPDQEQDARGGGVWSSKGWRIVISMPLKQSAFTFARGMTVPLAFALWDGADRQRNGQKTYAPWMNLVLA